MRKAKTPAKRKPIPAGRRSTAKPKTTKAKSSGVTSAKAKSPAKSAKSIAKPAHAKAKPVKRLTRVAVEKTSAPKGKSTKPLSLTAVATKARPVPAIPTKAPVALKPALQVPKAAEKPVPDPDKVETRSARAEPRPHAPSGHAAGAKAKDVKKPVSMERERSSVAHATAGGGATTGVLGSGDSPLAYGLPTPIASFII